MPEENPRNKSDVIYVPNEIGGVCSTYGGKERCTEDFGGET
jgi:hypothetical protein